MDKRTSQSLGRNHPGKVGQQSAIYWNSLGLLCLFRNKTVLFFKIESWKFQHLFEINFGKPRKISTPLAHSDNCYFHPFCRLSHWVEILWSFTKVCYKRLLKVSWTIKKFHSKKKKFRPLSILKQKRFVFLTQFSVKVLRYTR